jgi:hypothetical protein
MTNPNVGQGTMISRMLISPPLAAPAGSVITTTYRVSFE